MGFALNLLSRVHFVTSIVTTVGKVAVKVGRGLLHSNLGFFGLDRISTFLGLN